MLECLASHVIRLLARHRYVRRKRTHPGLRRRKELLDQSSGQPVKASAAKINTPSLRPVPKMTTPPETARNHPVSTERRVSSQTSAQPVGRNSSAKARRVPGRPQLLEAKKAESPQRRHTLDACARKSLPPPITRVKNSVYRPELPLNVSRRNRRYGQEKEEYAVPVANMEYVSQQKGQERPGRNSQALEQQAVRAGFPSCTPKKRSVAPPRPYPRVTVETKKHSIKQRGTATLPSRSSTSAAQKADLVAITESGSRGASVPKKYITYPSRESKRNVLKAAVSPAKSGKFSARPADPAKEKSHSAYLLRDIERPGLQPYSGSQSHQRASATGAHNKPADVRGLINVPRGAKFEPFKPPSTLEEVVATTGGSYATPIVMPPPSYKFLQKRLSSFPGLHNDSQINENLNKPTSMTFSTRDEIVAMQRVAGVCVFVFVIATTLFIGYYVSWSFEDSEPTTYNPPITSDNKTENNGSLPLFPLMFGNKNWIDSETLK